MSDPAYAELGDLKARMKIDDDERDDTLLAALVAAARSIDRATHRRFWLDETAVARVIGPLGRVVGDADGQHLLIPDLGSASDLVVEVGRPGAWADITAQVEAEPTDALDRGQPVTSLLRLSGSWPAGGGQRVRVTERWGWPEVPDDIAEANLIQAQRLFKRKDSPEGITGSAEWGVVRLSRRDPDVWALIESYIDHSFA